MRITVSQESKMVYITRVGFATSRVSSIRTVSLSKFDDSRGLLTALEFNEQFDFFAKRIFMISAHQIVKRGQHAHRTCNQILIPNLESVFLNCYDTETTLGIELEPNSDAILIPAGIWVEINLKESGFLTVLCDEPFNESDYIRALDEFELEKNLK